MQCCPVLRVLVTSNNYLGDGDAAIYAMAAGGQTKSDILALEVESRILRHSLDVLKVSTVFLSEC